MNPEFDGPPLAAGSVLGVRAFKVDGIGRLRGVTKTTVFRPGENVARCIPFALDMAGVGHRPGSAGCGCGYWGFYDGSNDYSNPDRASAIIEGYGLVTLGGRGFRAEKARLVALVPPARSAPRLVEVYGSQGVPIFGSLPEALMAHPVTHPRKTLPHPDTDLDFWDRDDPSESDWASVQTTLAQMQVILGNAHLPVNSGALFLPSVSAGGSITPAAQPPPDRPRHVPDTSKTYPTSGDNIRRRRR